MKRIVLLAGCVLLAACSSGAGLSVSVISTINTIGTGNQRVLVELRNSDGELISLDAAPTGTLRDENGSPVDTSDGELVWVVPEEQPAYAFYFDIPVAETYQLTVDGGESGQSRPAGFVAVENPVQVGVGEIARPISGPDVVGPALVVFATPEWCQSESCEPMVDQAQAAVGPLEGIGLVLVDVFANPDVEEEDDLLLSPDVNQWGLPSQPWLYAVDESGRVVAVYEGALSDSEMGETIDLISS